jgi:hypothetical protein
MSAISWLNHTKSTIYYFHPEHDHMADCEELSVQMDVIVDHCRNVTVHIALWYWARVCAETLEDI